MGPEGIGFGERLPDLGRPDAAGAAQFLYDLMGGRPTVLAALPRGSGAPDLLAAFALASSSAVRIALSPTAVQQPPTAGDPITVLIDDGKALAWLRGSGAAPDAMVLVALDSNQRAVERREVARPAEIATAMAALTAALSLPRWAPAGAIGGGAPALIIPRVFEPALCAELVALFERDGGAPSQTFELKDGVQHWRVDPGQKMRRDFQSFDAAWNRRFGNLIQARVLPELDKCFAFRASGFEAFKLSRYDAGDGGYHRPHRDNVSRDVQRRRFAMSINLNSGDYEGGQLRFPEYGPELYLPPRGGAVVFSCSMLHEALPVTRGSRYVFLTFFDSDQVRGPHLYYAAR